MADLTAAIRDAIVSREYRKAQKLWTKYMAVLRARLLRGELRPTQMDEARELLEWARLSVLCARAHLRKRIRGLEVTGVYGAVLPPAPRRGRFRAEG